MDFQSETENAVFGLLLVEFANAKPEDTRADCLFIEKNLSVSGPEQFKLVLFKGRL